MKKRIIKVVAVIILLVIIAPYLFVETNTLLYGDDFANEYKQTGMIGSVKYFKVFYNFNGKAKVYYVDENTGTYVFYRKKGKKWKLTDFETVWSEDGSASEITFPIYFHWYDIKRE